MNINRRDWLKTAFLGSAALTLSPLEFLANETPNFNELKYSNETIDNGLIVHYPEFAISHYLLFLVVFFGSSVLVFTA